jgi:hypothetical protein
LLIFFAEDASSGGSAFNGSFREILRFDDSTGNGEEVMKTEREEAITFFFSWFIRAYQTKYSLTILNISKHISA